jgi:Ni,Fe-hydrogenase III small subunit
MSFKPKDMIPTNKIVSVYDITKQLSTTIPKNSKDPVTTYLQLLVEHHNNPTTNSKEKIKKHYLANKAAINKQMSPIKNDFGEILGGIATVNQELLKKFYSKVPFKTKGSLEYPTAANEPLKDYSVYVGSDEYIISAKVAGSTSNTVKPQDVISLIEKSKVIPPKRKKELQSTLEYNLLKILQEENVLRGPAAALSYFKDNAPATLITRMNKHIDVTNIPSYSQFQKEFADISSNISVSKKTSKPYSGTAYNKIINSSKFKLYGTTHGVGKVVNWADIVLYLEYVIQNASKQAPKALDFGDLFIDAITSQIHYIKLTVDSSGIPVFEPYASVTPPGGKNISNFDAKDIYIRSKSSKYKDGRYRLKDKIGIQT